MAEERTKSPGEYRAELLAQTIENARRFEPYRKSWSRPAAAPAPEVAGDGLWPRDPERIGRIFEVAAQLRPGPTRDGPPVPPLPPGEVPGHYSKLAAQGARALRALPLVTKDEFWARYEENLAEAPEVSHVHYSTGTTGGELRVRYRTREEAEGQMLYLSALHERLKEPDAPKSLMLYIDRVGHGAMVVSPFPGLRLPANLWNGWSRRRMYQMLQKEFSIPGFASRITEIDGELRDVLYVTFDLLHQGIDPRSLAVRAIVTRADHLSRAMRAFLERTWDASVVDQFGLSEVAGSALRCLGCGRYHFDLMVHPEYCDPFTRRPVQRGLAVLVLTELYPFVQFAPLVRYFTGDLVEVQPAGCGAEEFTFLPKGRLANCLQGEVGGERRVLLASGELLEVLDALPDVARITLDATYSNAILETAPLMSPFAQMRLVEEPGEGGRREIQVRVRCRYSVRAYPERAAALRDELRERLLAESPCLRAALESGAYALGVTVTDEAVPPLEV